MTAVAGMAEPLVVGEPVAVEVATGLPELRVGVRWSRAVDVALRKGICVAALVAVLVFDSVGDSAGIAVLIAGLVESSVLVFVAASYDVEVTKGQSELAWRQRAYATPCR
jgi:hypothetical protein